MSEIPIKFEGTSVPILVDGTPVFLHILFVQDLFPVIHLEVSVTSITDWHEG